MLLGGTESGMTTVGAARLIGIGQWAVTKTVQRGGNIVKESGILGFRNVGVHSGVIRHHAGESNGAALKQIGGR